MSGWEWVAMDTVQRGYRGRKVCHSVITTTGASQSRVWSGARGRGWVSRCCHSLGCSVINRMSWDELWGSRCDKPQWGESPVGTERERERDELRLLSENRPGRDKLTGTVGMFEESSWPQCIALCLCLFSSSSNNNLNYGLSPVSGSVCESVGGLMRI